ncbi:hypothetical protein GCM10009544_55500 [Streptomyces stramineus]|uniref:Uncharacterized protein n=1 Tax=Streptomyces stramineus TaxID=173861 RepID=A0ABN1AZC0_9ACTN
MALLTAEGARRRVRIELERAPPGQETLRPACPPLPTTRGRSAPDAATDSSGRATRRGNSPALGIRRAYRRGSRSVGDRKAFATYAATPPLRRLPRADPRPLTAAAARPC